MSLRVGFKVLKAYARPINPLCILLVDQDASSQLLAQRHACLPAAMIPTMMVTDSNPLEL